MTTFPEVDDIMIYTYDQQAWICSEFGPCPRCSGLPLHERLPGFINLLNETMQKHRPDTMLWWKPWELSKGQTVAILDKVNPDHFGLMLNPSSSNEVYPFNDRSFKSDLGVKRLVRMALERDIPVVGEFDHTLYKPLYLIEDYFPRLVYEQMRGWKEMEGVIGIKEYYGFSPVTFSVNAAMLKAWIRSPDAPLQQLLQEVAAPYGEKAAPIMIAGVGVRGPVGGGLPLGHHLFDWPDGTGPASGRFARLGAGVHSRAPLGTRRSGKPTAAANFMLTEEHKAHPWLFEDAGLRLEDSAALGFKAVGFYDQAIGAGGSKVDDIRTQREIVWNTSRSLRAKSLHFLITLAAQDARTVQHDDRQFALVSKRLEALLKKDVENQGGNAAVAQELAEFQRDPKAWVTKNFNPLDFQTKTTIDWSKWVPRQD